MKERKREEEEEEEEEGDNMNRHLGERAGEATFLTLPVFCWIRERINLAGCFHVRDLIDVCSTNSRNIPPVCPAARSLALLFWIEFCVWCYHLSLTWRKKLEKKTTKLADPLL